MTGPLLGMLPWQGRGAVTPSGERPGTGGVVGRVVAVRVRGSMNDHATRRFRCIVAAAMRDRAFSRSVPMIREGGTGWLRSAGGDREKELLYPAHLLHLPGVVLHLILHPEGDYSEGFG